MVGNVHRATDDVAKTALENLRRFVRSLERERQKKILAHSWGTVGRRLLLLRTATKRRSARVRVPGPSGLCSPGPHLECCFQLRPVQRGQRGENSAKHLCRKADREKSRTAYVDSAVKPWS